MLFLTWKELTIAKMNWNTTVSSFIAKKPNIQFTPMIGIRTRTLQMVDLKSDYHIFIKELFAILHKSLNESNVFAFRIQYI